MPDPTPPATGGTPDATGGTPATPDFDTWIASQDATVKGLLDAHTGGLRSALDAERTTAKALAKQVKELATKADQATETGKQLADLSGKLEAERSRADFVEAAAKAGCTNPGLAWKAAKDDGLTVAQAKEQYPELFAAPRPPTTNAGNGQQLPGGAAKKDMNNFIRQSAGIRVS